MPIGREEILAEIRRTAATNDGKALGRGRFLAETGIRESDWLGRYWARWGDAVSEAGLEPNRLQGKFSDDEALRLLAIETRRLGRLPTSPELRLRRRQDPSFPSASVFERIGPRAVLGEKLLSYCEGHGDFSDIVTLVGDYAKESRAGDRVGRQAETVGDVEDGFVYLLKMGRHFKLGRTNSLGRRGYKLAIQLPERASGVHALDR